MIWTILGFSVAIIAAFCVLVAELFVGKPFFENHREYVAGILAACGIAAWFVGRMLLSRKSATASEGEASAKFILFDLRYWGPILFALGVITLFIRPLRQKVEQMVIQPAPQASTELPAPTPAVSNRTPAVFPKLKLQGIIFRETHPFAIIDGQSYTVGITWERCA